jgi:hypothetical protein
MWIISRPWLLDAIFFLPFISYSSGVAAALFARSYLQFHRLALFEPSLLFVM